MRSARSQPKVREPVRPHRGRLKAEDRRRQLVEATLRLLARRGSRGTSLRLVARELGVAPSLVNYFFAGWGDLLRSAYRLLAGRALSEYEKIAAADGLDARGRLLALIERNVAADWLADEVVGAHIALWDLSRTMPALKADFARFHRRRRRLVAAIFDRLAAEHGVAADSGVAAAGFVVFLDGLWLELGLSPGSITRPQAARMCESWIEANFPRRAA